MAGKHTGAHASGGTAVPGFSWNDKNSKAYAEGRGAINTNQHPAGSEASVAWIKGDARKAQAGEKYETAS